MATIAIPTLIPTIVAIVPLQVPDVIDGRNTSRFVMLGFILMGWARRGGECHDASDNPSWVHGGDDVQGNLGCPFTQHICLRVLHHFLPTFERSGTLRQ